MILLITFYLFPSFALPYENEFTYSFLGEKPLWNDEKPKLCKKNERKRRNFIERLEKTTNSPKRSS